MILNEVLRQIADEHGETVPAVISGARKEYAKIFPLYSSELLRRIGWDMENHEIAKRLGLDLPDPPPDAEPVRVPTPGEIVADLVERVEVLERNAFKLCEVCENGEKKAPIEYYDSCTICCRGCGGHGFTRMDGTQIEGYPP